MNKYPESKVLIRFQHCDLFGHLNNSQYFPYFFNTREDHAKSYYGFDSYEHAAQNKKYWLVGRQEITYLRPATPGELVTIRTGIISSSTREVAIEATMFDEAGKKLKAILWTHFKYVDTQTGRAITHGEELQQFLDSLLLTDIESTNMAKRIVELKKQFGRG